MRRLVCRLFRHRFEVIWTYGPDGAGRASVVGVESIRCIRCGWRPEQ